MRLATLSDDTRFENQKPLRHLLAQMRFLNQQLARRQQGSKNREKTKRKLARLHYRIRCLRDDLLHKMAHQITERYSFIGLETLNVRGMFQNRQRALSASDAALGRLARLIETKAQAHGTCVQRVGRFFPSTKRCHRCHHLRDIAEDERTYVCFNPACGWTGDRDLNAALNILEEALRLASLNL
jgi:putative transposase